MERWVIMELTMASNIGTVVQFRIKRTNTLNCGQFYEFPCGLSVSLPHSRSNSFSVRTLSFFCSLSTKDRCFHLLAFRLWLKRGNSLPDNLQLCMCSYKYWIYNDSLLRLIICVKVYLIINSTKQYTFNF